jgi:hypothetical protein
LPPREQWPVDPAPAGLLDLEGLADLLEDLHLQGDSHQAVHQDSLDNPLKATETAVLVRHPSTNKYHYQVPLLGQ